MKRQAFLLMILVLAVVGSAQFPDYSEENPSTFPPRSSDTLDVTRPPPQNAPPQKIKIRKRTFNFREQVLLAVGMMAFILVLTTTVDSFNPG